MILVDTSVIVAWLDKNHPQHEVCRNGLVYWAAKDRLAVSSVSYAELAVGGRTLEGIEEDLEGFLRTDLDRESAWKAGLAFKRSPSRRKPGKVLPDFFIRAQAEHYGWKHLTNDRGHLADFPGLDFIFPEDR